MIRHWLAVVTYASIAACATSGTVSSPPAANSENGVENTAEVVANSATPVTSQSEAVVVDIPAVVDIPEEAEKASAPGITEAPAQNQVVCKRERRTGSNRAKKVCRTRAQIANDELEGKDKFEGLHRSQKEYQTQPSN